MENKIELWKLRFAYFISNFVSFSSLFLRRLLIFKISVYEFSFLMSFSSLISFLSSLLSISSSRVFRKMGIPNFSIFFLSTFSFLGFVFLFLGYFLSNAYFAALSVSLSLFSVFYSGIFEVMYARDFDVKKLNLFDIFISISRVIFLALYLVFSDIVFLFAMILPFFYPILIKGRKISLKDYLREYSISWIKYNKRVLKIAIIFGLINAIEAYPIVFFSNELKILGWKIPLVHQMMISSLFLTLFWCFVKPSKNNLFLAILIRIFMYIPMLFLNVRVLLYLYYYLYPVLNSLVWVLASTSSRMLVLIEDPGEINLFNFVNSILVSFFYFVSPFFLGHFRTYFMFSVLILLFIYLWGKKNL